MFKKKRVIFGGLVVLVALGILGYMGFKSSATYYYLVDEVLAQGNAAYEQSLRVEGKVVPGSVVEGGSSNKLQFTLAGETGQLPVVYKGAVPDAFYQADAQVVVEGRLTPEGVFQASALSAKCPSKYEAAE